MAHYMLGETCPHCQGNGRLRITHPQGKWRIYVHYQDGHEWYPGDFSSLEEAQFVVEQLSQPPCSEIYDIVSPTGEVL